jgi:hypothetical protein
MGGRASNHSPPPPNNRMCLAGCAALLARLLADAGVTVWYDMEAERLEVADMCRGE